MKTGIMFYLILVALFVFVGNSVAMEETEEPRKIVTPVEYDEVINRKEARVQITLFMAISLVTPLCPEPATPFSEDLRGIRTGSEHPTPFSDSGLDIITPTHLPTHSSDMVPGLVTPTMAPTPSSDILPDTITHMVAITHSLDPLQEKKIYWGGTILSMVLKPESTTTRIGTLSMGHMPGLETPPDFPTPSSDILPDTITPVGAITHSLGPMQEKKIKPGEKTLSTVIRPDTKTPDFGTPSMVLLPDTATHWILEHLHGF